MARCQSVENRCLKRKESNPATRTSLRPLFKDVEQVRTVFYSQTAMLVLAPCVPGEFSNRRLFFVQLGAVGQRTNYGSDFDELEKAIDTRRCAAERLLKVPVLMVHSWQ